MGENDFNHPVKVVWRDMLRKHMALAKERKESERAKLFALIQQFETLYYDVLADEIQS